MQCVHMCMQHWYCNFSACSMRACSISPCTKSICARPCTQSTSTAPGHAAYIYHIYALHMCRQHCYLHCIQHVHSTGAKQYTQHADAAHVYAACTAHAYGMREAPIDSHCIEERGDAGCWANQPQSGERGILAMCKPAED